MKLYNGETERCRVSMLSGEIGVVLNICQNANDASSIHFNAWPGASREWQEVGKYVCSSPLRVFLRIIGASKLPLCSADHSDSHRALK